MPNLDRMAVCERIAGFDFGELFTQELGWDYPAGAACHTLTVGAEAFAAQVVAEKRGVRIFHVAARADGSMPHYPLRRALDAEITKLSFEHLNIFTDNLIAATTTRKGLKIRCALDLAKYPTARKVSDDEVRELNMTRFDFHGERNYMLAPKTKVL